MNMSSNAQDYFYYLDGEKVPFSLSNSTICLKIDPSSNVQSIISSLGEFGKISSSIGKTIGAVIGITHPCNHSLYKFKSVEKI